MIPWPESNSPQYPPLLLFVAPKIFPENLVLCVYNCIFDLPKSIEMEKVTKYLMQKYSDIFNPKSINMDGPGLIAFLKTNRSKEDLKIALSVLNEFKSHESNEEWLRINFSHWAKLEQFSDYLKLLTGIDAESVTDDRAREYIKSV